MSKGKSIGLVVSVLAGLMLVVVLFFAFAPDSRVGTVKTYLHRLTGSTGQACLDLYADNLNDPASAQLIDSFKYSERIYVTYKSKNKYGAYEKGRLDCPLENGEVDKTKVVIEQMNKTINNVKQLYESGALN